MRNISLTHDRSECFLYFKNITNASCVYVEKMSVFLSEIKILTRFKCYVLKCMFFFERVNKNLENIWIYFYQLKTFSFIFMGRQIF